MRLKLRTTASLAIAISVAAVTPYASAQVTLNLTTTQQTNCVATTDVNGLTLVPGSTALQATGVTLNGTGCVPSGAGNSNFGTTVTAPANASAGTPFNVIWTASASATQCTYAGTAGASGWPVGVSACSGGACAGSHPTTVTAPAGGAFTFAMSCTNSSGFAAQGTTVNGAPPSPPSPPNFALTVPGTVNVNVPFQVSWNVSNATTCTGMASLDGNSTSLSGWTDSTSPVSPRTVTATQAGSYSLQLTCSNNGGGSVTSQLATTTASSAGGGCPAGQQTSLNVSRDPPGSGQGPSVDATQYAPIWARLSGAFPGDNLAAYYTNLDKTKYIAAKFTVPANSDRYGEFTESSIPGSPNLTMKLSQTCGDFTPDSSFCFKAAPNIGAALTKWRTPAGTDTSRCLLVPGNTYYVNLKVTDPSATPSFCTGNSCKGGVINNHHAN